MPRKLSDMLTEFASRLGWYNNGTERSQEELVWEAVEQAKRDWLDAQNYFNSVVEPDLVDIAIYSMDAAERKYMYLLKQAKAVQAQQGRID